MGKHNDIINLPRPHDPAHQPMSLHNRAAQFAPFDALTGFGGRIWESSRITKQRIELTEERQLEINQKLTLLLEHLKERPEVAITFFVPDKTKTGGSYITEHSRVRKVDEYEERIFLENDTCIAFDDILNIEGVFFGTE